MVAGQRLAGLELDLEPAAVLTAVTITGGQESGRHLTAEATGNVDEPHQPDHRRARQRQLLRSNYAIRVSLNDLRLSIDHQPQGAAQWHHCQRLERRIQCQTTNDQAPSWEQSTKIYN